MTAVAARTHVGLKRRRNEDSLLVGEHLVAVADGMGGHVAGDVASSTVIAAVAPFDKACAPDRLAATLGQAVHASSIALQRRIAAEPETSGMGTTLVALMWSRSQFALASIGDSRAYSLRAGKLTQLTDDHVFGRMLSCAGAVPHLPERLARFLDGRADGRSPDLAPLDVRPGDRLLLCSDGLSSFVPHAAITSALSEGSPDETADRLIELALEQGGPDNITVIVVDA